MYIKNIIVYNTMETKNIPLPLETEEYTIYGATWCKFCVKAKELLDDLMIDYVYHDIDDYGVHEVFDFLKDLTFEKRTIPIVFHKGQFLGGYDSLKEQVDF